MSAELEALGYALNVNGKAAQARPREQLRLMAQRLLENRFGVVLTREQRKGEVYALRLARGDGRMGPDLRRAADDCLGEAAGGGLPRNEPARPTLKSSTGAGPTGPSDTVFPSPPLQCASPIIPMKKLGR